MLNILLSLNKDCIINKTLNKFISSIKGLAVIINAAVYIGRSHMFKQIESVNGSLKFLTYIFDESNLMKENVIPYTYITNKSNLTDRYNFAVYFKFLEKFTNHFNYSILETFINILQSEFKELQPKSKTKSIHSYFFKTQIEIDNVTFLNFLINQRLKK